MNSVSTWTGKNLDWLRQVLDEHKKSGMTVVECGPSTGESIIAMFPVIQEMNGHILWIDRFSCDPQDAAGKDGHGIFDVAKLLQRQYSEMEIGEGLTTMVGGSAHIAPRLADASIDVLILHRSYCAPSVIPDIQLWFPKVKMGGLLCGCEFERGDSANKAIHQSSHDISTSSWNFQSDIMTQVKMAIPDIEQEDHIWWGRKSHHVLWPSHDLDLINKDALKNEGPSIVVPSPSQTAIQSASELDPRRVSSFFPPRLSENAGVRILFLNPQQYIDWEDEPSNYELRLPLLHCGLVSEHRDLCYQHIMRSQGHDAMNRKILQEVSSFHPDLVVYSTSWAHERIDSRVLQAIMNQGIPLYIHVWDTWIDPVPQEIEWFKNCTYFGLGESVTNYLRYRGLANKAESRVKGVVFTGGVNVFTDQCRKLPISKSIDVALLGSLEGQRVELIAYLQDQLSTRNIHFEKVGGLVDSSKKTPHCLTDNWVSWDDYVRVINQSKICLSSQTVHDRYQLKGKIFQYMACGAFCLSDDNVEVRRIVPDGCLVYYKDQEDLVQKIEYYLKHEEERQAIADAGYRWYHKTFDYKKFWSQFLQYAVRGEGVLPEFPYPKPLTEPPIIGQPTHESVARNPGVASMPMSSSEFGASSPQNVLIFAQRESITDPRYWWSSHWNFEEGLKAKGIEWMTIPGEWGYSSKSTEWFRDIQAMCKGKKFDQVWVYLDNEFDEQAFRWITTIAPVRIGIHTQSDNTSRSSTNLHAYASSLTHLLVTDEEMVPWCQNHCRCEVMWFPPSIPARFLSNTQATPSSQISLYHEQETVESDAWIQQAGLTKRLTKYTTVSSNALHDTVFRELNLGISRLMAQGVPINAMMLEGYFASMKSLWEEAYEHRLQDIHKGSAITSFAHDSCHSLAFMLLGMAAMRPTLACRVNDRPLESGLFRNKEEYLVFDQDLPSACGEGLDRISFDREFAERIADNAHQNLKEIHTSERRIQQVNAWVGSGKVPVFCFQSHLDSAKKVVGNRFNHESDKLTLDKHQTIVGSDVNTDAVSGDSRLQAAKRALGSGAVAEAEQEIRCVLALNAFDAEAHLLLGIVLMQQQTFENAVVEFEQARHCGADRRKTQMGIGMASLGAGKVEKAWEIVQSLLPEFPDDLEAVNLLIQIGTELKRWGELRQVLENFLGRNPANCDVRFALAGVLYRGGYVQDAQYQYDMLCTLKPDYEGLRDLKHAIQQDPAAA